MAHDFERFRKYYGVYAEAPAPWNPPVGEGWHGLIYDALVRIDEIVGGDASKFRIEKVKEKFGTIRFYYTADQSVYDELEPEGLDVENRSETMCEECGAHAEVHDYQSWYKNYCPDHAAKFIFKHGIKLGARGWKLGMLGKRVVLLDKETGGELGDAKFREIDARVEANRATRDREDEADVRVSSVKSSAASEIKYWRHATYVAQRRRK